MNLKINHIEATKAGAEISNTDSLASVGKDILHHFRKDLIVNYFNLKRQSPSWLEAWADTDNAGALHNYRTQIKIKRLIGICVQYFRGFYPVKYLVGIGKYRSFEQLLVRHSTFSGDLEVCGGLGHSSIKMCGWLVDFTVSRYIEMVMPFLGVINSTRLFSSTLAHRFKFWYGKPVLHKWSNTLYGYIYRIHFGLITQFAAILFSRLLRPRRLTEQRQTMREIKNALNLNVYILSQY